MEIVLRLCPRCGNTKAEAEFYKTHPWCKSCVRIYTREWRRKNPEKTKATREKYLERLRTRVQGP